MSANNSIIQTRRCVNLLKNHLPKNRSFTTTLERRSFEKQRVICKSLTISNHSCTTDVTTKQGYTTALSNLTKDQAQELVFRLTEAEKQILLSTLKEFESNQTKSEYEGQLAGTVWRSRFGRPAKLRPLGEVDPTGAYCAVPDDWLHKKFVEITPQPLKNDLMKLAIINALPFVGFGFLDNFTMIIAGDYIDHTLGIFMSISTMAAAALGNTISDVLGIGSAYYVERAAEVVGVKPPKLTPIQLQMKSSRRSANIGRVLGITIGCLLGMCPLLFMDTKKKKEETDAPANLAETTESASVLPLTV